jgi:hypothetical protein
MPLKNKLSSSLTGLREPASEGIMNNGQLNARHVESMCESIQFTKLITSIYGLITDLAARVFTTGTSLLSLPAPEEGLGGLERRHVSYQLQVPAAPPAW